MKTDFFDNMAPNAQRGFITTLIFAAVSVALYMFAVVPEQGALERARRAFAEEETNKSRIDSILKNATDEKNRLAETIHRLRIYHEALLERKLGNYATHARELLDPLAIGAGLVEIDYPETSIRKLPLPDARFPMSPAQLHVRATVRMTAHGSYQSAISFLLRVEKELPLVAIQSLRIAASRTDPRRQDITFVFEWPALDDTIPPATPHAGRR